MKTETRIPPHDCPACGYRSIDRTTSASGDDHQPKGGDVTLCVRCGHALLFNDDLTVRPPTLDEQRDIDSDIDVAWARVTIQRTNRGRGRA